MDSDWEIVRIFQFYCSGDILKYKPKGYHLKRSSFPMKCDKCLIIWCLLPRVMVLRWVKYEASSHFSFFRINCERHQCCFDERRELFVNVFQIFIRKIRFEIFLRYCGVIFNFPTKHADIKCNFLMNGYLPLSERTKEMSVLRNMVWLKNECNLPSQEREKRLFLLS